MAEYDDDTGYATDDLVEKVKRCRKTAKQHQADWRDEAREAYEFRDGDQWSAEDRARLEEQHRPLVTFNRVAPVIDAVAGYELNNRREIRYLPRTVGDQDTGLSELYNAAAAWVRDRCDAEDEESDAYADAVTSGMGWIEIRVDYDEDPDGKIVMERVPPLEMRWDPGSRKHNLGDRNWDLREKKMLRTEIEARWPKRAELVDWTAPDGSEDDDWSGEHDATQAREYRNSTYQWSESDKDKALVTHYQWREREPYIRLADPKTGQMVEMDAKRWKVLERQFEAVGVQPPKYARQTRWIYKYCYICGSVVLESGDNPVNDWTRHAVTAKRDERMGYFYGLMRAMKDPQRWANKFFSQAMHIFQSNAKGGLIIEEDAVPDLGELERTWADPSGISVVENGTIAGGRLKEKDLGGYPASLDKLLQFAISSIRDSTGVNLEILGMTDREQSGVVEASRKQAALTVLAPFSNSLRRYRKMMGRTLLEFMRAFIPPGTMMRIAGPHGDQRVVPFVVQDDAVKFDVVVDTAPNSPNLKAEVWDALQNMVPAMVKAGVRLPPELIRFSPLPESVAEAWIQQEKQANQVPPHIQQQMQVVQQRMQELTQENLELKTKRDQHMADLQMKRELQLMELQGMREEAILKAKIAEMEIAAKLEISEKDRQAKLLEIEAKYNLEMAKSKEQAGLDRERFQQDLALQREKASADIGIKREQNEMQMITKLAENEVSRDAEDAREVRPVRGEIAKIKERVESAEEKRARIQSIVVGYLKDKGGKAAELASRLERTDM